MQITLNILISIIRLDFDRYMEVAKNVLNIFCISIKSFPLDLLPFNYTLILFTF